MTDFETVLNNRIEAIGKKLEEDRAKLGELTKKNVPAGDLLDSILRMEGQHLELLWVQMQLLMTLR